jgi:hypothetical protein
MCFLGALFVLDDGFGFARCLPSSMMLLYDLGLGLRLRQTSLLRFRVEPSMRVVGLCFFDPARVRSARDVGPDAPRGGTGKIARPLLAVFEALSFDPIGFFYRVFELRLRAKGPLRFLLGLFGSSNGVRENTRPPVDALGASSFERVERILSRHDQLMIAHLPILR